MKQFIYIILSIIIISFVCINSSLITDGCRAGISLWYSSIVPVLLPFMLLTGIILEYIDSDMLNLKTAFIMAITLGLLCGFPAGTIVITFFYKNGTMSENTAQSLLPVCNNISPMFLYGYIYKNFLYEYISLLHLILYLYIPQILCTVLFCLQTLHSSHGAIGYKYCPPRKGRLKKNINYAYCEKETAAALSGASTHEKADKLISRSVHNITTIGVYIVIFSILTNLISHYLDGTVWDILSAFMEISGGIPILANLNIDIKLKTALILSLTSFGGLSALFQGREMIKESKLSFGRYIIGKLICATSCAAAVMFVG